MYETQVLPNCSERLGTEIDFVLISCGLESAHTRAAVVRAPYYRNPSLYMRLDSSNFLVSEAIASVVTTKFLRSIRSRMVLFSQPRPDTALMNVRKINGFHLVARLP